MYVRSVGKLAAAIIGAVLVVSGCECGGSQVSKSYGEIGLVHLDAQGQTVTTRDAEYDFGTIPMGERLTKKLVIQNMGAGALTLVSIERVEGDQVTVGTNAVQDSSWEINFVPETTIGSGESVAFDMTFTPTAMNATVGSEAHYVKLTLSAGGTRAGEETSTLILRGNGAAGSCDLPTVIDFGKVALGATGTKALPLVNGAVIDTHALVGDITSTTGDHLAFGSSDKGDVVIPAGTTKNLDFTFAPTELRAYEAQVTLRAGATCGDTTITLKGEGTDLVLDWTPTSLDFLFVPPNTTSTREVTFTNYGGSDVTLTNVQTSLPADFGVKADPNQDPSKFTVPANSQAKMTVICRPSQLGPRSANLTFQTPIAKQPSGTISLTCFGGGPDIQVVPSGTLNFGKTAYFSNANPPYSVVRRVTVMNVGSSPATPDPLQNLRLGKVSASGMPGQLPFISVKSLNAATAADEFSVGLPPTYDANVGLEAKAGKNLMDLTVTLTPKSLGQKQAELTIYSNDSDEPETRLLLTADVVQMPPCNYTVSPASVNFGLVSPGTFKEVPVTFTNNGVNATDICLISGVDLSPGTDPSYQMPNGAIPSKELGPGESFQALVRVQPTGQVPNAVVKLTGTLQYFASSPTKPSGTVPLETSVGPSCLTIAPSHQDFGAAKPGCSSNTRTFTIYNICPQTVTLTGFAVQAGAGQPAGGPNCPGTSPCPEFHLVQTPAIPTGGLAMAPGDPPVTFQAKYKPIDLGPDSGVISVTVVQSGLTVPYLVTLEGKGDAQGQQTDTFTQDFQPKADVLFTIDDSGSMSVYQSELANNFASFIQYATSAGVDWQIGVTTTNMDDAFPSPFPGIPGTNAGPKGRLIGDANNPKILTPTTPNVAQKFQQKVNVGTDGSGTETGLQPSLLAVTPPLSVSDNAGFLRPDANLAIVVVTDAPDQSGQPASYYLNSFLNVKGFNKANMFTFNAIAGFNPTPPSTCAGYDTGPDDGSYASVVTQTNGIKEEICTQNWAAALQGLGKTAFGFRTTFFLTAVPDLSQPMTVQINGATMPPTSGQLTNWHYDGAANAIVFDQTTAPGPGETLTITYFVGCLP